MVLPTHDTAPADQTKPGFLTRPLTPKQATIAIVCSFLVLACITCLLVIFLFVRDPRGANVFGVKVTDVRGLDPVNSPMMRPSFDLDLRVDNRGIFRDCWENITITVFYGDKVMGWGSVPDFCTDRGASVQAKAAMSHTDVVLTEALRGSMASQLNAGELEFEVEMRMLFSKGYMDRHCSGCAFRQGFQLCTTNPGQVYYTACKQVHLYKV